jgi:hypothetical protein
VLLAALFAVFVAVNVWGWVAIPNETRLPFTFGISGVRGSVAKATGLVLWLMTALLVFWGAMAVKDEEPLIAWMGVGVLGLYLAIEYATVRRLSR